MIHRWIKLCWIPALLIFLPACTPSLKQAYPEVVSRPLAATAFFSALDQEVRQQKVQNVVYARIPGFPYLRADRFLAESRHRLGSAQQKTEWLEMLRAKNREARRSEIYALPLSSLEVLFKDLTLAGAISRENLLAHAEGFAEMLFAYDSCHPHYFDALQKKVTVPDDYSTVMRTLGLYPLAYLPVAYFSNNAFDKMSQWHQLPPESFPVLGEMIFYAVEAQPIDPSFSLPDLYSPENLDAFGLPRLTTKDKENLAHLFAPVIQQDSFGSYDRIGRFEWPGKMPALDLTQPTVYYYVTFAFKADQPVVQINYSAWYTARDGKRAPWFERGEFDGLTIRISLDDTGRPFMLDIMNSCGCYHFYVPDKKIIQSVVEPDLLLNTFIPTWLPSSFPDKPINIRVNSGWHQIEHIGAYSVPEHTESYNLVPYQELESLPRENGQTGNLFDDEGILKGSYRIEPYIFFSMGIPKVGYMRQRGHHPTKMLGREHFDNPLLFNRHFTFNN